VFARERFWAGFLTPLPQLCWNTSLSVASNHHEIKSQRITGAARAAKGLCQLPSSRQCGSNSGALQLFVLTVRKRGYRKLYLLTARQLSTLQEFVAVNVKLRISTSA
jgi:hypothetical protein